MSAYVVDRTVIDGLVASALEAFGKRVDADAIGDALVTECVRSVAYRYPNDDVGAGELPGPCEPYYLAPYRFPPLAQPFTRAEGLEAIDSYIYQSCEHPQWHDGPVRQLVLGMRQWFEAQPVPAPPVEPAPDPDAFLAAYGDLSRAETIRRIRAALKRRSGKAWSVTGDRGTAWGWLRISAPPKRCTAEHVNTGALDDRGYPAWELVDTGKPGGYMTPADAAELAALLGLERVHFQGESIASSSGHYREYIDRAEGRPVQKYGVQYWD